jgi:hypothetical protein
MADHFAARTYLKRWCDRAKNQPIHAYRKPGGDDFFCWPESVCCETDGDLNPKYFVDPTVLGQFRAIFEPRWDAAVDAIEKRTMTADDKFVVAGYWANLISVTPASRKLGQQLYEREIQSLLAIIAKKRPAPANSKNVKLTVEVDEDYVKAVATKQLLNGALQLYHQPWTILTNDTAHEFLTSDNPSAIYPPLAAGGPVVRILPLSPRLCISTIMERSVPKKNLTPDELKAPPNAGVVYHAVVTAGVKLANKLTIVNADRFVFSRMGNGDIVALVKKYGDYSTQLEHSAKLSSDNKLETQVRLFIGRNR